MNIFKKRGFIYRIAFRSADTWYVPDKVGPGVILILFVSNIVAVAFSNLVIYPLVFYVSYLFAKRTSSRETREGPQ